jgi:hypothetical protein
MSFKCAEPLNPRLLRLFSCKSRRHGSYSHLRVLLRGCKLLLSQDGLLHEFLVHHIDGLKPCSRSPVWHANHCFLHCSVPVGLSCLESLRHIAPTDLDCLVRHAVHAHRHCVCGGYTGVYAHGVSHAEILVDGRHLCIRCIHFLRLGVSLCLQISEHLHLLKLGLHRVDFALQLVNLLAVCQEVLHLLLLDQHVLLKKLLESFLFIQPVDVSFVRSHCGSSLQYCSLVLVKLQIIFVVLPFTQLVVQAVLRFLSRHLSHKRSIGLLLRPLVSFLNHLPLLSILATRNLLISF